MARVAQNYANKCIWAHNSKRTKQQSKFHYVGENIYVTTSPKSQPELAVTAWHNEVKWYKFGKIGQKGTCKKGKMCGHYTQVSRTRGWYVEWGMLTNTAIAVAHVGVYLRLLQTNSYSVNEFDVQCKQQTTHVAS